MEAVKVAESREWSISRAELVWLGTVTLVGIGLALRARGFLIGTIPFWEDEAAWTKRLLDQPLSEVLMRPMGFMAVSKLLAKLFGPYEAVLRLLPWCAGVAAVLLSPALAKRLFSSGAAQLLFVGVIALHPGAIDLAKEFKPYSLGLALHMAFALLGLRYAAVGKTRDLIALLGLLFVGVLFSQDTLFAFPAVFGLLLFQAWRAHRVRHVVAITLVGAATIALLVTMYVCVWSKMRAAGDDTEEYWGKKYDVFYVPDADRSVSRVRWAAGRVGTLAALPGMRREHWAARALSRRTLSKLRKVDAVVWQGLGLLGACALLYRWRRWREGLLLLGPLPVLLVFNTLGYWPLGAFRTNLFALVYAAGLAAAAFDWRQSLPGPKSLLPVGALVVVPFLLLDRSTHAHKTSSMSAESAFPRALQELMRLQGGVPPASDKSTLILDPPSCSTWRYYLKYHPDKQRAKQLNRRFQARCAHTKSDMAEMVRKRLKSPDARAFMIITNSVEMERLQERLPADLVNDGQMYVGRGEQLVLRLKKASDTPASP